MFIKRKSLSLKFILNITLIMAKNLKSFCDSHKFDFPDFIIEEHQGVYISYIKWYNEYILNGGYHADQERAVQSSIYNLSLWASKDVNFIWLTLKNQNSSMKF